MNEERLIILRLLEQGKVTELEAEQLLDALGDIEYEKATKNVNSPFDSSKINLSKDDDKKYYQDIDNENMDNEDTNDQEDFKTNKDFEDTIKSIGKKIESIGDELEDKMDTFGEGFSETMVNLGSMFADKSIDFAEKIVDLVEKAIKPDNFSDAFNNFNLFTASKTYEEVLEKQLNDLKQVSLSMGGYNNSIHIGTWDESFIKFTASISTKENRYDLNKPIFEITERDGAIFFVPKQIDWMGIKLDVKLPKQAYNFVKVENKNGSINVDNLTCNRLLLQTKNGLIDLNDVDVEGEINCTTTNNKISIENSKSKSLLAVNKNGKIHINNCKFNTVEGLTSNGKITVRDLDYTLLESISLKTSNAKIEMFGQVPKDIGVHFVASTTHGNINISAPVVYVENIKNYSSHRINARSVDFELSNKIVFFRAYTSNSSINFYN